MSRRWLVEGGRASYHVVSRVVDRRFVLGDEERAKFRSLMGELLGFSGLECLAYCLMSNHFHLLLSVPDAEQSRGSMGDGEFFERLGCLYPPDEVGRLRRRLEELHRESPPRAEALRERYLRRMFSLPVFVQELKRRFSRWYNRKSERRGTLWEERYRSVLVEDSRALVAVAAYIDLNPVRAGLVRRPEKYRWCGFGEAVRGSERARVAIARVMDPGGGREWREVAKAYRALLSLSAGTGTTAGGGSDPATENRSEIAARGATPTSRRAPVRAMSEGVAIGSREFLEDLFRRHRERFGERRRRGARAIRGVPVLPEGWSGLGCLRDLR